jgi:hypothetical protein
MIFFGIGRHTSDILDDGTMARRSFVWKIVVAMGIRSSRTSKHDRKDRDYVNKNSLSKLSRRGMQYYR